MLHLLLDLTLGSKPKWDITQLIDLLYLTLIVPNNEYLRTLLTWCLKPLKLVIHP